MPESAEFSYEDIDARVCLRCGLRGEHDTPGDWSCRGCECVDALRARVADLEFRLERKAQRRMVSPAQPAQDASSEQPPKTERRGGRRDRKDARMVVMDGERLCLTDAARKLGLAPSALHFRIINRVHTSDYGEVDLRAIGADVVATPNSAHQK